MHVKKGDNVIVLTGKDKSKVGKILQSFPKENKVVVEGVNLRKVTQKPKKKEGKGTIVEKSYPIDASNVALKK